MENDDSKYSGGGFLSRNKDFYMKRRAKNLFKGDEPGQPATKKRDLFGRSSKDLSKSPQEERKRKRLEDLNYIDPYTNVKSLEPSKLLPQESQRDDFSSIFSGNVVLGENHQGSACKEVVKALIDLNHHKVFILEQVTKDLQGELDELLKGKRVEDLAGLEKLCNQHQMGHESNYTDMLNAFSGKGLNGGVRIYALDREGYRYDLSKDGKNRVVGVNQDCENLLKDLLEEDGDVKQDISQGKVAVFCGNNHICRHDKYSEPGIPTRLNKLLKESDLSPGPKNRMLFQGVHCRDISDNLKGDVFMLGKEIVALLPQESNVNYGLGGESTQINCFLAIDSEKQDGIIHAIKNTNNLPIMTDPQEVQKKIDECAENSFDSASQNSKSSGWSSDEGCEPLVSSSSDDDKTRDDDKARSHPVQSSGVTPNAFDALLASISKGNSK